jgi:hypothetical protein
MCGRLSCLPTILSQNTSNESSTNPVHQRLPCSSFLRKSTLKSFEYFQMWSDEDLEQNNAGDALLVSIKRRDQIRQMRAVRADS